MLKKTFSGMMLILLLMSMLTLAINIQTVKASETIYIRADGSIDPPTAPLYTADNVTYTFTDNINDSIAVYRSNITIDGAGYTLQGPGSGTGILFESANYVTVKDMIIKNFADGIATDLYGGHNIVGNIITNNTYDGIFFQGSGLNKISGNIITNNGEWGIYFGGYLETPSANNSLSGNIIANNGYMAGIEYGGGIFVGWETLFLTLRNNSLTNNRFNLLFAYDQYASRYIHDIDFSNTVDGKPVYYLVGSENAEVPLDAGFVALVNSDNITVRGLNLRNNGQGVLLVNTTHSKVENNVISNNWGAIWLLHSSNNSIYGNNIINNNDGILIKDSWDSYYVGYSYSRYNSISGNNITGNKGNYAYGISITRPGSIFATYNSISGNNIVNNSKGILVGYSAYNSIYGNNITANDGEGISIGVSKNNNISGNYIARNKGYLGGGIYLYGCSNSIISGNIVTENEADGIYLYASLSTNNTLSGNNIIANKGPWSWYGIYLYGSSNNNTISGNNIENNPRGLGILYYSSSNVISENNIVNNTVFGVVVTYSGNKFYHNNFIDNGKQVFVTSGYANTWDDGYPSGGNYWSDYTGVDLYSGPYQNETGSDGIGDIPYIINSDNQDRYPLFKIKTHDIDITTVTPSKTVVGQNYSMNVNVTVANQGDYTENFNVTLYANTTAIETKQVTLANGASTTVTSTWNTTGFVKGNYTVSAYAWSVPGETDTTDNTFVDGWIVITIVGDVNGDGVVDIFDCVTIALAYGSTPTDPNWSPNADITNDNLIDIFDLVIVALHFGETNP